MQRVNLQVLQLVYQMTRHFDLSVVSFVHGNVETPCTF